MTPDTIYSYTVAVWPPLTGAAFLTGLSLYSWRQRRIPGALPLAAGAALAALWLLGLTLETTGVTPPTGRLWREIQAALLLAGVTATTCFALEYSSPGRWLTRRNLILLALPTLGILLFSIFSPEPWMWRNLEAEFEGALSQRFTVVAMLFVAYAMGLIIVNTAAFLSLFVRCPQFRWPVVLMLFGESAARILYLLGLIGPGWLPDINLVVVAIVLVWTTYAVALFGFRILDPLGAARQTLLLQMREGMVVFNEEWRIVSANPAAEKILSLPKARLRGKRWEEVIPLPRGLAAKPEHPAHAGDAPPAHDEMSLGDGPSAKWYALNLSLLKDQRGQSVGQLLLLLDTTDEHRARAQIEEQQRTMAVIQERERLARELHDGVGQVLAFVNAQGQATRRLLARGEFRAADEHLVRLVEVTQEADADIRESIMSLRAGLTKEGLLPSLARYLAQYEQRYGIRTQFCAAPQLGNGAFEPPVEVQLLRITQEALSNARKHAEARSVSVALEAREGWARLIVEDDGRGFEVQEALANSHGRVGLRVMQERAKEVGASIDIQSAPGRGTRVIVALPLEQYRGPGRL